MSRQDYLQRRLRILKACPHCDAHLDHVGWTISHYGSYFPRTFENQSDVAFPGYEAKLRKFQQPRKWSCNSRWRQSGKNPLFVASWTHSLWWGQWTSRQRKSRRFSSKKESNANYQSWFLPLQVVPECKKEFFSCRWRKFQELWKNTIADLLTVLTDPSSASFAMQGDIILAEPKAIVDLLENVLWNKPWTKTSDDFQQAETVLEQGFIDAWFTVRKWRRWFIVYLSFIERSRMHETNENSFRWHVMWKRPTNKEWINAVFDDFIELHGDRYYADDSSVGGIATLNGKPVTVIGMEKGHTLQENLKTNLVSPSRRIPRVHVWWNKRRSLTVQL